VVDAFASIGRLKSPEAFRSWIMKILYSKIKKKQKEYYSLSGADEEAFETAQFNFESAELKNALESLDDESRTILSLSVLGGYSGKEISAICGIKESTVRSRLTRIKQKLREEMAALV
jgi:RNA polymerase sigma-70 factor (ECF subfamily)